MKKLIFPILLILSFNLIAQEDKTVTLTVSGQGKTQDEAKQNALRSAIEQAFGAFISSKTEILNDELVKDEIVSVSSGNIQKFEIISEVEIPDGGYATSLKATVSVSKLTSFVKSKGVVVEFKGNILAANIKLQMLNENNEKTSISNVTKVCKEILDKSFDFEIVRGEPKQVRGDNDNWAVHIEINASLNENIELFTKYLLSAVKELSMGIDEIEQYGSLGKKTYKIALGRGDEFAGIKLIPRRFSGKFWKQTQQYKNIKELELLHNPYSDIIYSVGYERNNHQPMFTSRSFEEVTKYIKKYNKTNSGEYSIWYLKENQSSPIYHFRTLESVVKIIDLINYVKHSALNFQINNGLIDITPDLLIADNEKYYKKKGYNFKITQDNLNPIFNNGSSHTDNRARSQFGKKLTLYKKTLQYYNYYNYYEYEAIYHHIDNYFKDVVIQKYPFLLLPELYEERIKLQAVVSMYDFINYFNKRFVFSFNDILSLSELEKVTEYKINAISK